MNVDRNVILHQNRKKNLLVEYEKLKDYYSTRNQTLIESGAKSYKNQYESEPLTFIIENSRYIFSEPLFGFPFYKETLSSPYMVYFSELPREREKVSAYVNENGTNMPAEQKKEFESLLTLLTEMCESHAKTIMMLNHGLEKDENLSSYYTECVNSIFNLSKEGCEIEKEKEVIYEAVKNSKSPELFFSITPYVPMLDPRSFDANHLIASNMHQYFTECSIDYENTRIDQKEWDTFIESVVIVSNLMQDAPYKERVENLRRVNQIVFHGIATESVKDQMEELYIEHVVESEEEKSGKNPFNTKEFDCHYSTPVGAVNRIFDDMYTYEMAKEKNEKDEAYRDTLHDHAINTLLEYVEYEYYHCDDVNQPITGYNYFTEGTTIEQAFLTLSEAVSGKATPVVAAHSTDYREKDDEDEKSGKKSKGLSDNETNSAPASYAYRGTGKPKPKNLANKVQIGAQNLEVKQQKSSAAMRQKGQEIGNAAKAVARIPGNILNNIKNFGRKWSEADDNKRKKYMIEPGYRSQAFRNLKLALMYGATASYKITLMPVLMILRHFSKNKDVRIRRELARELDTEIHICEEKISDANANGDQKEKYRLMRIKSQLEQEALRVKTNSKLV